MSEKGIGAVVGLILGLLICVIIFKVCNRNSKLKCEYDERQEMARGRAYKYGFYTAIVYLGFMAIWPLFEIKLIVDNTVLSFIGVLVSICVMAVYAIWHDAYWGLNNNKNRYILVFILATVINLANGIISILSGHMVEDGVVQAPCINLLCGLMFLIIAVTLLIKDKFKKDEEEE